MAEYLFIDDFTNPLFTEAFMRYFSELGISVHKWDELWREMNDGATFAYLCVENSNEVTGFIQFSHIVMKNYFFEEEAGFIREFWVREDVRRHGCGSYLLGLAEKYFLGKGITRCILTTDSAEHFYAKRGYRRRINVIAANGDAVFAKELTEYHALESDGSLGDVQFICKAYEESRDDLHGEEISEDEWKKFLSANDEDEKHFLIYHGSSRCGWLKINGLLGDDGVGWISTLVIEKDHRKKGIGRFAVNFAERYFKGMKKKKVCIYTTADNMRAQHLYKSCGYSSNGRSTDISDGPGTAEYILFTKNIR